MENKLLPTLELLILNNIERYKLGITGYDMTKLMNGTHSHQQVYRTLSTMYKDGILSREKEPQEGKPDKNLYKLASKRIAKDVFAPRVGVAKVTARTSIIELKAVAGAVGIIGKQDCFDWLHRFIDYQIALKQRGRGMGCEIETAYRGALADVACKALEVVNTKETK